MVLVVFIIYISIFILEVFGWFFFVKLVFMECLDWMWEDMFFFLVLGFVICYIDYLVWCEIFVKMDRKRCVVFLFLDLFIKFSLLIM